MSGIKGLGLAGALALAAGSLGGTGCVSADQHRGALADLQRLRMEAWQKGVEAAALRMALDRAAAENAQLRAPAMSAQTDQVLAAVAARLEELSNRQDALVEEVRANAQCAPAGTATPVGGTATAPGQPRSRKVTDLLYSRF